MLENTDLQEIQAKVVDISPVIILLVDCDHNIIWSSKAFQTAAGKPLKETAGRKCFEVWGNTAPCANCPVAQTLATGKDLESIVSAEGNEKTPYKDDSWLVKSSPILGSNNRVTGALATVFEVHGNRANLERYENTMASLMNLMTASVHLSSSELLRMFLDEAESLTESTIGFYHFVEDDQTTLSLQMWSTKTLKHCTAPGAGTHYLISQAGVWVDCVRKGEPVIHNDYNSLTHKKGLPEGHVPVTRELVVPVLRGEKLLAILGVGNKETDYDANDVWVVEQLAAMAWEVIVRKRTEEENKHLHERYIQAQKMESIGRLAGGVAHDFNNMLSIITGHAELGLQELPSGSSMEEHYREILEAANRSADITRQLLTFARRQAISKITLNLNEAIHGMLKMLRRFIGESIELEWRPGPDLWMVKMDPIQIDQLLANLCINSRDAITDVGTILIETENKVVDEQCSSHNDESIPGEFVRLTVSDTGCGMDTMTCANIFEPFFTTKKDGLGTGLGLATVYGIVKQSGGFIDVVSEPGKGTSIHIYLSRHHAKPETLLRDLDQSAVRGGGETILVVEDEAAILKLTCKILEKLGYTVVPAATPRDALQKAEELKSTLSLLITDVVMPEMNGKVLSDRILEINPEVKCLYMSGYTDDHIAHHGVLEKGVHFISKPLTQNELAVKVKETLDS